MYLIRSNRKNFHEYISPSVPSHPIHSLWPMFVSLKYKQTDDAIQLAHDADFDLVLRLWYDMIGKRFCNFVETCNSSKCAPYYKSRRSPSVIEKMHAIFNLKTLFNIKCSELSDGTWTRCVILYHLRNKKKCNEILWEEKKWKNWNERHAATAKILNWTEMRRCFIEIMTQKI